MEGRINMELKGDIEPYCLLTNVSAAAESEINVFDSNYLKLAHFLSGFNRFHMGIKSKLHIGKVNTNNFFACKLHR